MSELSNLQARIFWHIGRNEFERAQLMLEDAFRLDPDATENHVLAARAALGSLDYGTVKESLAAVLSADPENAGASALLFRLQDENGDGARRVVFGLLEKYPESAQLHALYAGLMLHALRPDRAAALAHEALRLDRRNSLARTTDVMLRILDGRPDAESVELEGLFRREPDMLLMAEKIVVALRRGHRFDSALAIMRVIRRADPENKSYIKSSAELKALSHWSMIPLWPKIRYGWIGLIITMGLGHDILQVFAVFLPTTITLALVTIYMAYGIYWFVWMPVLSRWFRWKRTDAPSETTAALPPRIA